MKNGSGRLLLGLLFLCLTMAGRLYADLQAFIGRDVVELTDGTRIECLVVMESTRGILVILPDPEKGEDAYRQQFIPADQIKTITRGTRNGETRAFQTDTDLAGKIVQGNGLQSTGKAKPAEPAQPTGPIAPATPPVYQKPAPQPVPALGRGAIPPGELAEAYLRRFPGLQDAADQLFGGQVQLAESLGKALSDPATRQEAERMLDLFFQTRRSEAPASKPGRPKGVKPAPQTAKPAHPVKN